MPPVSLPAARVARPGEGELRVGQRAGESRVLAAYATSPLQLVVNRGAGPAVWAYVAGHGGGLVDGDAIALTVEIGAGARALLATQTSTKVYRRREDGAGATQRLRATVAPGALFASLPEPICCFARSRFVQELALEVADGGSLAICESLVAGRVASGERWAFERLEARLDLASGGRPLLRERTLLADDDGAPSIGARMGRFDALATLVLLGPLVAEQARARLEDPTAGLDGLVATRRGRAHVSASPLGDDGALIRIAAEDAETVAKCARAIFGFLAEPLGDDPFSRRP
jgi:urease accessory protein